jgi:hypothetical protein
LAGAVVGALLLLVPDLLNFIPLRYRPWWFEFLVAVTLAAYGLARALSIWSSDSTATWARRFSIRLDLWADAVLERWPAIALFLWCLVLLAGWVPHYLTWPMNRDDDTFAVLAQSWDCGILPYRDILAYNFPGQTYLFWVLGKTFGWGCPVAFRAFDAVCVGWAGVVMMVWSRARLGGVLPGLIAYLAFLDKYLDLDVDITAERDWYTALLVCTGIAILETRPGWRSRLWAAIPVGLALTIRPYAALFLPAIVSAIMEDPHVIGRGLSQRVRVVLGWCVWLALLTAIGFAPVVVAGIGGDFVRSLRLAAYGGPYSKATGALALASLVSEFATWKTVVSLGVTVLIALERKTAVSAMARTWLLALLAALVYRPIAPIQHFYLMHPLFLVGSITLAFAVAWFLGSGRLPRIVVVLAVALLGYEIMPAPPAMFSLTRSWRVLGPLVRGEMPATPPLGCRRYYPGADGYRSPTWDAYRGVLAYIRARTGPRTLVANVINRYPYPPLNGPTGRPSPFRAESGICWMVFVEIELDSQFAQALEAATDSIVVWEPDQHDFDPRIKVGHVIGVIRKHYEPAARFDGIEIWTRKHEPSDR